MKTSKLKDLKFSNVRKLIGVRPVTWINFHLCLFLLGHRTLGKKELSFHNFLLSPFCDPTPINQSWFPWTQWHSLLLRGEKWASSTLGLVLLGCGRTAWWTIGTKATLLWCYLIKLAWDNGIPWNGNTSINAVIIIKDRNVPLRIDDRINCPYAMNHKETIDRKNPHQGTLDGIDNAYSTIKHTHTHTR
jgi:hypothetical protein